LINNDQRLEIFIAQTENVRELEKAWLYLNRQLNEGIRSKSDQAVAISTKFLALSYCALAEAKFSKLIHTPYGLHLPLIDQIKAASHERGVKAGWEKCIELTLRSVPKGKHNHLPNVRKKLLGLVDKYIFDPSLLRNKLAHGQWVSALNRDNTAKNAKATAQINNLDVTKLYKKKFALEKLSSLVEDLIESPTKAHLNSYWDHIIGLESRLAEMDLWTYSQKKSSILSKATGARCVACGRRS
jgi:hypothetical protein